MVKPPITFKESEINENGFDENFIDAFGSSLHEDKTMKGAYGFDGFTYLKPEIMSITKD